jgi:hypothetical protein
MPPSPVTVVVSACLHPSRFFRAASPAPSVQSARSTSPRCCISAATSLPSLSLKLASPHPSAAAFRYSGSLAPRRLLTKPADPAGNGGWDNVNHDLIVAVGDEFVSTLGTRWARCAALLRRCRAAAAAGPFGRWRSPRPLLAREGLAVAPFPLIPLFASVWLSVASAQPAPHALNLHLQRCFLLTLPLLFLLCAAHPPPNTQHTPHTRRHHSNPTRPLKTTAPPPLHTHTGTWFATS